MEYLRKSIGVTFQQIDYEVGFYKLVSSVNSALVSKYL